MPGPQEPLRRKTRVESPDDPLRILALGGGTGLSSILRGLKRISYGQDGQPRAAQAPFVDIGAVVTVTDDGGSSGRLRRSLDILATGDIRACMVALAEDEALLSKLFNFRFAMGRGLRGHSFGNLFLAALTHVTGDFHQAVQLSSEVLAIHGNIFPSTLKNVQLVAEMNSGLTTVGESRISASSDGIRAVRLKPRRCAPLPETLRAIQEADLITLGPGSLYTSVIPNLLVEGIPEAIQRSQARKVYICNLMWQPGETVGYSAGDHAQAILNHSKLPVIDCVILNNKRPPEKVRRHYAEQNSKPVSNDLARLKGLGIQVVTMDALWQGPSIKHDPEKIAHMLVQLAREARRAKRKQKPA